MEPKPNMELHKFSSRRFILLKNNYDMEIFPVTTIWRLSRSNYIILEAVKGKHILFIININYDDDDDDDDDYTAV